MQFLHTHSGFAYLFRGVAIENLPHPLDVIQQGRVAEIAMAGEVDHPGKKQIIELGINLHHGARVDRGSSQGEIDVGGLAMAAYGAGATKNRLLHLGVSGQHLLDGADSRFGQAVAPRCLGQVGGIA